MPPSAEVEVTELSPAANGFREIPRAPCSGDGTVRKNPDIWASWSAARGVANFPRQLAILRRALELLEDGGRCVYSTCSLNPIENEAVVAAAIALHNKTKDAFYQRHRPTLLRELCGADAAERLRCRSEGGVGLLNQGATCYANSLLQALFYIPEFRLAVYRWRPEHDEKGGSRGGSGAGSAPSAASSQDRKPSRAIAVQLQRMFAQMQLSSTRAISTLPFTTACDFTGYGARVQQDVQEYCRVLFSALEEAAPSLFADAEKILAGRARSYVRCCEAGFAPGEAPESCREEKFLDLQVPIQDCSSLEEALQKLSQPETLSGENRWLCEDLGRKVDAVKGVEFLHLPSTLCIQLMRFAFDPLEMRESKVTSKLRIPFWIDLSFLRADAAGGPLEYELAAAFVREWGSFSGTDCGTGAMYAQWRHLNDAQTALVSTRGMTGNNISDVPTEVWDAGGADSSGFASDDAYFLIYRQVGVGQEFPVISDEEVPQPHRSEIEEENVKLALLRRMCAIRKKFIEVKIYTPTGASLLFQQRISQQFRSLMDRRTQMSEKAQPSACPGGCGFEITWHSTHCCALCRDSGGRSHGPKCDKKSSEEKVDQAGAVPCANGCGFIRTWHETHCCDACSVSDGTTHGARCLQRLPLTDAHEPCRGSCGYARTWHATHCCAACKASGGKEHGQKCEQRWYLPELIPGGLRGW
ncbi:unnamed protein product [Prorocentrum cordatum]|uniref:Ubiquitinyl hydrolase 1 n=1 Tax=Prorocentrum cordatum TaxID=2364126 RepID=A0ABN9WSM2_9DINO|nr:unnamed protein product [Polarella glacialis]